MYDPMPNPDQINYRSFDNEFNTAKQNNKVTFY